MLRVVGGVFLGLGGFLALGNYWGIAQAQRTKTNFSCIPILGGLFGSVGWVLFAKSRWLAFIPLFADPGSMPMVLALIVFVLSGKHRQS